MSCPVACPEVGTFQHVMFILHVDGETRDYRPVEIDCEQPQEPTELHADFYVEPVAGVTRTPTHAECKEEPALGL